MANDRMSRKWEYTTVRLEFVADPAWVLLVWETLLRDRFDTLFLLIRKPPDVFHPVVARHGKNVVDRTDGDSHYVGEKMLLDERSQQCRNVAEGLSMWSTGQEGIPKPQYKVARYASISRRPHYVVEDSPARMKWIVSSLLNIHQAALPHIVQPKTDATLAICPVSNSLMPTANQAHLASIRRLTTR